MLTVLYQIPSSSQLLSDIGDTSSPFFSELLPIAEFGIGVFVAVAIIAFLIKALVKALKD